MIHVTGPRLLVRPREDPPDVHQVDSPDLVTLGESEGGLALAAFAGDRRPPVTMGRVVALGTPARCPHCKKGRPFEVVVGDVIVFAPTAGEFVYLRDQKYLIIQAEDVLAVVEKESAA